MLIYPLTRNGEDIELNWVFSAGIGGVLWVQVVAAVGWSGISMSWLSAEKKYGLWHSKSWSYYYLSFILVGVGVGVPAIFIGLVFIGRQLVRGVPIMGKAFYDAYAPLLYLYQRCFRLE